MLMPSFAGIQTVVIKITHRECLSGFAKKNIRWMIIGKILGKGFVEKRGLL
jgi:hypothetical protein